MDTKPINKKEETLELLSEIIKKIPHEIKFWDELVKNTTRVDLHLKVVAMQEISESEWTVSVNGKTHYDKIETKKFKISWDPENPKEFIIMQFQRNVWGSNEFRFLGLAEQDATLIAKELSICVHEKSIDGILSKT